MLPHTKLIISRVKSDLTATPPKYTSPADLATIIPGINAQMVAQACTRYLTPEQKTLRKSLQPVGRRWIGHEQR